MSSRRSELLRFLSGIRARVAAFVFITASFSLVLCSFLISRQVLEFHRREFDSELYNLVEDVSREVQYDAEGLPWAPAQGFDFGRHSLPFPEALAFFQLRSSSGTVIYRSPNLSPRDLPWAPTDWQTLISEDVVFHELGAALLHVEDSSSFRLISVPLRRGGRLHGVFQVAVPLESIDKEVEQLSHLFAIIIPLLVVSLALGSYWIAGRALLPLRELISRTRAVAPADLSVRLPIPETGDEIAELSRTLNHLLSRLQSAFASQERFIADASHQLKTPLAVLQGEIELLRGRSLSGDQVQAFLLSAHEEVRHLSKLVEGLLLLARVSAMPEASLVSSTVRLDELLIGLLERYRPALERRGIKCRFHAGPEGESQFEVRGDEDLLRSLFETLIENAVKYSPEAGVIEVELLAGEGTIEVKVCDQGRGIPEAQRERIFERFFRGDAGTQGFGLGLTIARQIAQAHQAEIRIEAGKKSGNSGTCAHVEMKKISSDLHS